jgi:transcriptional regulator with XRE-family HTH domain
MSDSESVRSLRRELGRQLAAARKDSGFAQREFARRINYARSTLSTVESGVQRAGKAFWEACDHTLKTGGTFARSHDRIQERMTAEKRQALMLARIPERQCGALSATTISEALRAYESLGWPVVLRDGSAELVTGTVLDALEVPRTAGLLAASWWRCTGGTADEIRGLPALPDPHQALAVIACHDRAFFLAAAGSYPWADLKPSASPRSAADAPVIGWHSGGSPIPAPPSPDRDGQPAAWAYPPTKQLELASPVMLLDLLAKAITATRPDPHALTLPGGVLAVPAVGSPVNPARPR